MPTKDEKRKEYEVLGLDWSSSEADVKRAFVKLALHYHPDQFHGKKCADQEVQLSKLKFYEVCRAYKKIMSDELCSTSEYSNDKSDEIFFSLLAEHLPNSTKKADLYALLSSQANHKPQFQNDNEYRCAEDAYDEDELHLNKLLDIIKNRLQNGKSVPAGITHDKLAKLKDDFLRQKEENKRTDKLILAKKVKSAAPVVPVAKPKPKSKKQLQAEQHRREMEMAEIAHQLEEKKRKEEEKDSIRKQQESERQLKLEEETRRQEEEKKKQLNDAKKKKEREEKEREQKTMKDKQRQERLRKQQEEELRRKEEEKRRKTDEKTTKQKSSKDGKEKEDREKLEQSKKSQSKRQQQYQQYQQQQQKYPREVPPRFLKQQQLKQQVPSRKEQDRDADGYGQYSTSGWTEIGPDTNEDSAQDNWDADEKIANQKYDSWGGDPVSENWDVDGSEKSGRSSNRKPAVAPALASASSCWTVGSPDDSPSGSERKEPKKARANLFGVADSLVESSNCQPDVLSKSSVQPAVSSTYTQNSTEIPWGASLTGSTWDSAGSGQKHWNLTTATNSADPRSDAAFPLLPQLEASTSMVPRQSCTADPTRSKVLNTQNASASGKPVPGVTLWAGLDSFESVPASNMEPTSAGALIEYPGQAKPESTPASSRSDSASVRLRHQLRNEKVDDVDAGHNGGDAYSMTPIAVNSSVSSLDVKLDSNLKVSGWLQSSGDVVSDDWDEEEKDADESWGWTTVASVKAKVCGKQKTASAPGTPSKSECNAWTNRALQQLIDMGFKRGHAEKALRDNNGIVEGAVNDLVAMGDSATDATVDAGAMHASTGSQASQDSNPLATQSTQKLNRKQRRKLQQLQNQRQAPPLPVTAGNVSTSVIASTTAASASQAPVAATQKPGLLETPPITAASLAPSAAVASLMPRSKQDGLLPTPPPSLRLIAPGEKPLSRPPPVISQPAPSRPVSSQQSPVKQPQALLTRQTPPVVSSQKASEPYKPSQPAIVGSERPSISQLNAPAKSAVMPPVAGNATQQQSSLVVSSSDNVNASPVATSSAAVDVIAVSVEPLAKPVLSGEAPSKKAGVQDLSHPSVSTHAITNAVIEQYLQKITKQSSDMAVTPTLSTQASVLSLDKELGKENSEQASALNGMSGVLPQAPLPASSLLSGPHKSKLLQWTQGIVPTSEQNGEETALSTPLPSSEASTDKVSTSVSIVAKPVDPVSAKWGVIAAPRLSPTPAEFKPGVRWKPRDGSADVSKDTASTAVVAAIHAMPVTCAQPIEVASQHTVVQLPGMGAMHVPLPPTRSLAAQAGAVSLPLMSSADVSDPSLAASRPPPGLNSANAFSGFYPRAQPQLSWLLLKGLTSAVDPMALRSLCQQYGTLLHFRVIDNIVYVRYETMVNATQAKQSLNGKTIFNAPIIAELASDSDYESVMEAASAEANTSMLTMSLGSHAGAHLHPASLPAPTYPSTYGALWTTQPPASSPPAFLQPAFASQQPGALHQTYAAPLNATSSAFNGVYSPWGLPGTTLMPSASLWAPAPAPGPVHPQSPYPAYSGWLQPNKQDLAVSQMHTGVLSPTIDQCLPSGLLTGKEMS